MATLQAQPKAPCSSTPKITAFNAIVELIKEKIPTEVLVSTDCPQKGGRGEHLCLFEPQTEPLAQLLWHQDTVRALEASATEISHPSSQTKRD